MLNFKLADMLNDPGLSAEERQWLIKFEKAAGDLYDTCGLSQEFTLFAIASSIGLDISNLHKENLLLFALWMTILHVLSKHVSEEDFKYETIDEFLEAYEGRFSSESEAEKTFLWTEANWMNILFKMISARKNKGLVLYVIPKLVEGWDVKYVTGSGQTKATASRVCLFETEGNTKANQRGRLKTKKKASDGAIASERPKKRRKNTVSISSNVSSIPPYSNGAQTRRHGTEGLTGISSLQHAAMLHRSGENSSDEEESAKPVDKMNQEVKKTFEAWQEATENYGLGLLNLSRGNSFATGLAHSSEQQLSDPMDYRRGYSWTDIPVAPNVVSSSNSTTSTGSFTAMNTRFNSGTIGSEFPFATRMQATFSGSIFPPDSPKIRAVVTEDDHHVLLQAATKGADDANGIPVGSVVPTSQLKDLFQGY